MGHGYIVRSGGGSRNCLKLELLWENGSPSSAFAEQSVSFNWNGCSYYIIEYCMYSGAVPEKFGNTGFVSVGNATRLFFITDGNGTTSGGFRDFEPEAKKFGKYTRTTDGATAFQGGCVPIRIYGVKGVPES